MSLQTGVRLGDRYELVGRIAVGGMGEVWRARDITLGRTVAVKVLRSEFTGDATFLTRFRNEARNTAMLSHPNIAQVYDYGEAMAEGEHVAYLVMELIDGEPLSAVLANGARLPPARTLDILGQTAAGLGVAHSARLIHRDVKPANLILRPDRVVKITDFGISRAADHVPLTGTGMVVGTAQYLAPEQAMGRDVTPASDVYALGVVGYEALSGHRPFDGASSVAVALAHVNDQPAPLPGDVPPAVRDLILRAMSKDPQQRFADGTAFAAAIRAVAKGQPLPTQVGAGPVPVPLPMAGPGPGAGPSGGRTQAGVAARGGKPPTARMPAVSAPRSQPPRRPVSYAPRPGPPRPADKPRTGQWVAVLVLVALLIAGGLIAVWATQQDNSSQADGSSNSTAATGQDGATDPGAQGGGDPPVTEDPAPEPVLVDTASYVGQPIDDVEAALTSLGLVVERQEVDVSAEELAGLGVEDQPFDKNAVITTDPAQTEVPPGTTVTVFYSKKNYEPDSEAGTGNGNDDGGDG